MNFRLTHQGFTGFEQEVCLKWRGTLKLIICKSMNFDLSQHGNQLLTLKNGTQEGELKRTGLSKQGLGAEELMYMTRRLGNRSFLRMVYCRTKGERLLYNPYKSD